MPVQKKTDPPRKQPDYSKAPPSSLKLMGRYIPPKKEKTVHPVIKPFYKAEQRLEMVLGWLQRLALLEILGIIGNVGIIIAVLTYVGSEKQRRDAEVLNAWQTITSSYGQAGSGGRIQALEFLNASPGANWRRKFPWFCAPLSICVWPAESLAGINLAVDSPEKVAEEGEIDSADSTPTAAGITGVYLIGIQLQNAGLMRANLEGADLAGANLEGAFLSTANLEGADLTRANLEGVESLKTEQITQAKLCFTKLPETIGLPKNRDCAELGIDPETGKYR